MPVSNQQIDEILNRVKQAAPYTIDTPSLRAEIGSRLGIGHDPNAIYQDTLNNASEVTRGRTNYINNLYQPQIDAGNQRLEATRGINAQDYSDLETRLKENATGQMEGLRTDLSNRGFLRSGEQIGGGEKIARDTTAQLNRGAIQRTLADAQATLENAGFQTDIGKQKIDRQNQLADQQFQNQQRGFAGKDLSFNQQLQQSNFDLGKIKSGQDLITSDQFMNPYSGLLKSNPALAKQLLQQYGFEF